MRHSRVVLCRRLDFFLIFFFFLFSFLSPAFFHYIITSIIITRWVFILLFCFDFVVVVVDVFFLSRSSVAQRLSPFHCDLLLALPQCISTRGFFLSLCVWKVWVWGSTGCVCSADLKLWKTNKSHSGITCWHAGYTHKRTDTSLCDTVRDTR